MSEENKDKNPYEAPSANLGSETTDELGGRGARLGAAIIDTLIMLVIVLPAVFFFGFGDLLLNPSPDPGTLVTMGLAGFVVYALVQGYFLATRGQTLGKMVVGVRIVDAESKEIIPLWKVLGLRVFVFQALGQVPFVGPLILLVDVLFIFSERRRCLHDLLARTIVVNA